MFAPSRRLIARQTRAATVTLYTTTYPTDLGSDWTTRDDATGLGEVEKRACTKQRAPEVDLPPAGRRRLHAFSSETLRFSLRKVLHIAARENACASPPATTLDLFLIENRRVPLPGSATHLRPRRPTLPLSRRLHSPQPNLPYLPGPAKLARLLPARAARGTLCERHHEIKYFLMRAQENLHGDSIASKVGSPKEDSSLRSDIRKHPHRAKDEREIDRASRSERARHERVRGRWSRVAPRCFRG